MTGNLAQLIALAAYGNDFLQNGREHAGFYPDNTAFQFCRNVDFATFRKPLFSSRLKEHAVSANPADWFQYLKKDGCQKLRLYFQHSKDQTLARDHKMAGFAGGGGTWFLETVYPEYSNYWAGRWRVTDEKAPDRKIWSTRYGLTDAKQPARAVAFHPEEMKEKLQGTLTEIAGFAFAQNLDPWGHQFVAARSILDSEEPEATYYHKDLLPVKANYTLAARQLLFAAGTAWVFGGMGSWNDQGFDDRTVTEQYERLSERLYSQINEAFMAAVNSF